MVIDPFRFARKGEQLDKVIRLSPKGRLHGIITEASDLRLQMTGGRNEQKRFMLEGFISGEATAQCQVCLMNMSIPVKIEFTLFPVSSEQQAERLQENLDPIIIEDNCLELAELVTNELILSMPVALSHAGIGGRDCVDKERFSTEDLSEKEQKENQPSPFAILKSIKRKES